MFLEVGRVWGWCMEKGVLVASSLTTMATFLTRSENNICLERICFRPRGEKCGGSPTNGGGRVLLAHR